MRFKDEYFFLSNMCPAKITFKGRTYPSVENFYQSMKFNDEDVREAVANCESGYKAKELARTITRNGLLLFEGRDIKIRSDWDTFRLKVMRKGIDLKFNIKSFGDQLIATGDTEIVEDNWWGDRFWGVYAGEGENNLGKILMEKRAQLVRKNKQEKT